VLTVGGLRTNDKDRMRSIGGRVLLIQAGKAEKEESRDGDYILISKYRQENQE
jgi:hypothetical protein